MDIKKILSESTSTLGVSGQEACVAAYFAEPAGEGFHLYVKYGPASFIHAFRGGKRMCLYVSEESFAEVGIRCLSEGNPVVSA